MKTPNPTSRNQKTRALTRTLGELRIEASKNEPNGLAPEGELSYFQAELRLTGLCQATRWGRLSAKAYTPRCGLGQTALQLRRRRSGRSWRVPRVSVSRALGLGTETSRVGDRRSGSWAKFARGARFIFYGDIWCYLVIVFWKKAELDANCANFHERSTTDGHSL
jgi:hypothetical protein